MTGRVVGGEMMPNLQHSVMCIRRNPVPGAPETHDAADGYPPVGGV